MSAARARRGALEAPLVFLLSALLVSAILGTITRRMDAGRDAIRLDLSAQLTTALESVASEAWWYVKRSIPVRGNRRPKPSGPLEPGKHVTLYSRVLGELCERTAGPSTTPDRISIPGTRNAPAGALVDIELEDAELAVGRLDPGGMSGLIAIRASGRARRGPVDVSMTIEHRRAFQITMTEIGDTTLGTIYLKEELVETGVSER